jgi:tetratricopeptide (TPR) repeat protein
MKVIRAGLQEQPKSFELQLTLAGLMEAKEDYESAIAEYELMLKDQPGSLVVANNLASLLADRRTDKASLEKANSLAVLLTKSQVPQFVDTIGWIDYRRGNYVAAVSLLESAVVKLPNLPLVRYHLGMGYLATGQDTKASEQFKKARELAPNDAGLNAKITAALKKEG